MTEKLKPCPFCGGEAIMYEYPLNDDRTINLFAVGCNNENCGVLPESPYYIKENAIEAWNTRANQND